MISSSFVLSEGEKKRGYTEIAITILMIAKDGELLTNIAKKARLNTHQLNLYTKKLAKIGLVKVENRRGKRVCTSTEKGDQYLKQYSNLTDIVRGRCNS